MTQRKPRASNWELEAIRLAQLWASSQFANQADFAASQGITQSTVSRYLNYAFENGILVAAKPLFRPERIEPGLRRVLDAERLSEDLTNQVQKWSPAGTHCVAKVFGGTDRATFCALAAPTIAQFIKAASVVGLSLGGTLAELINSFESRAPQLFDGLSLPPAVIPVVGDLIYLMNQNHLRFSASNLAADLSHLLCEVTKQKPQDLPTLASVPAYVPSSLSVKELLRRRRSRSDQVRSWIESIPGYRRIFVAGDNGEACFADRVDCLITSVGVPARHDPASASLSGATLVERTAQLKDLTWERISACSYGEIGGYLVERSNDRLVEMLNDDWFGIQRDKLMRISQHADADVPGIVVMSFGAHKAEITKAVIKGGYCNRLIVDELLAYELLHH